MVVLEINVSGLSDGDGAVPLEAVKFVGRGIVFAAKSVIEFVVDRAADARHGGTLSIASAIVRIGVSMGNIVREGSDVQAISTICGGLDLCFAKPISCSG